MDYTKYMVKQIINWAILFQFQGNFHLRRMNKAKPSHMKMDLSTVSGIELKCIHNNRNGLKLWLLLSQKWCAIILSISGNFAIKIKCCSFKMGKK